MSTTILMVTDNIPSQINGVNTTYQNIESHAHLHGYRVVYLDAGQFPHMACPGYPEVKIAWPYGIAKKIKAIAPDHIHIQTEGPVGLFARWWCERNCVAYNTAYHTDFAKFLKKMYGLPEVLTWWYLRWFHKNSHRVLVTTASIRDNLIARGFKQLCVWTRGVDRRVFHSHSRMAMDLTQPVLLSVGRVSVEKGLDDFCQLNMPGARKIIVGDGPYRIALQRQYPDIDFVGVKTGAELSACYAAADVFVFASKSDTFGVVNIEAMACGTPVAAYPVPGPQDIVESGVTGFLNHDLLTAVQQCLTLDRATVELASQIWTWDQCWRIFEKNLVVCGKKTTQLQL